MGARFSAAAAFRLADPALASRAHIRLVDAHLASPQIVDYSTAKTGKHGSAKAMYVGIDIFSGTKHEDTAPTGANTAAPVVERTEWLLTDVNDDDANADGAIAGLLNPETGETRDDLRVPDDKEYANLREALLADEKDVFVTVIEAINRSKILPEFVQKDR